MPELTMRRQRNLTKTWRYNATPADLHVILHEIRPLITIKTLSVIRQTPGENATKNAASLKSVKTKEK